jgi:transposase
MLFGASTETTRKVMEKILDEVQKENTSGDDADNGKQAQAPEKAKGHGRNGAVDYAGAGTVHVAHNSLKAGDDCPECHKGGTRQLERREHST